MKTIPFFKLLLVFFCLCTLWAAEAKEPEAPDKMKWWDEARLGLFITWGPYSQWGGVYKGNEQKRNGSEWIMNRCKIPVSEYLGKARQFNPVNFDAEAIVTMAKNAGMQYIIFTAKHHDGFAMFHSKASPYNIVDYTPFKRDVMKELADACRKHGLKFCVYYSQSQDWLNPGGIKVRRAMAEGWDNPKAEEIDAYTKEHGGAWDPAQETATFEEYIRNVAVPQVKEITSNYGEIAGIFWDTPCAISLQDAALFKEVISKYPHIIENDRLRQPGYKGDYKTFDARIPSKKEIGGVYWEARIPMSSSWGYKSGDKEWKSPTTLIQMLTTIASRGGNVVFNVGLDGEGNIRPEEASRLHAIGEWMKVCGEAIYGTQESPLPKQAWGVTTRKFDEHNQTVEYLCIQRWPTQAECEAAFDYLPKNHFRKIRFIARSKLSLWPGYRKSNQEVLLGGGTMAYGMGGGVVSYGVSANPPNPHVNVVKLVWRSKLSTIPKRRNSERPRKNTEPIRVFPSS